MEGFVIKSVSLIGEDETEAAFETYNEASEWFTKAYIDGKNVGWFYVKKDEVSVLSFINPCTGLEVRKVFATLEGLRNYAQKEGFPSGFVRIF